MAQLLCTFSNKLNFRSDIKHILDSSSSIPKVFVLQNEEDDREVFLTYNIVDPRGSNHVLDNTISLHRKKEFNVLYSINALNRIVEMENNGILDRNYRINWENYRNCILILDGERNIKIIKTKLFEIVDVE